MTDNSEIQWRKIFEDLEVDIFDIIENAIRVAATDYPQNFRAKRDKIAEVLFSSTVAKHSGGSNEWCNSCLEKEDDVFEKGVNHEDITKEIISKQDDLVMVQGKEDSNPSAEDLSDELEGENETVAEVLRLKEILQNANEESEGVLLDSLRQLQLMDLSVDKLDATKIGINVNHLRKHHSKEISKLSKILITSWKSMVTNQWSFTNPAIAKAADTPEAANPNGEEEEPGLPVPPLDDGLLFLAQPHDLHQFQLSGFFDDIDDDGNIISDLCQNEELNEIEIEVPTKNNTINDTKRPRLRMNKQAGHTPTQQKAENVSIQTCPTITESEEESNLMDLDRKLEVTKRKLHEDYQQAKDVKKRRSIQVMDLCEIPKQKIAKRGRPKQSHVCGR